MKRIALLLIAVIVAVLTVGVAATSAQGDNYCNYPPPRLVAGSQARVTPGLPNVIRAQPWRGPSSPVVGEIPAGGVFTVLAGYAPQCSDAMNWYYISYNGIVGWTAEGSGGVYWVEPVVANNGCAITPRLTPGGQGRVTPGLPNVIRNQPWRGAGSSIIGLIPAGGVFNVQSGPSCANGIQWWLVQYGGVTGWTGEGEGATYWVEPASGGNPGICSGALPPHLTVGASAYASHNIDVPLYPQASSGAPILTMPAGSWFRVLSSPVCSEGVQWWLIRFNNYEGWIKESNGSVYTVDPWVCGNFMPSRLIVGTSARVSPGLPNNLRAQPSLDAQIVGTIPGGQSFAVVGGPQCGNNGTWWQVAYNGVYGWTMEGRGNSYWLEPFS